MSLRLPRPRPVRIDRRRRPFNRIPGKVLDRLAWWEQPVLGKVVELHPPDEFPRVCDVGGGDGDMARALRDLGYLVTVVDPVRPRPMMLKRVKGRWRSVPSRRQKDAFKGIKVRRRKFKVTDARDFDLLVGMRPCGASQTLVRAARRLPLVMLPCTACCRRIWPGRSGTIVNIERCFRDLGVGFRREGRVVFWTGESRKNAYVD